MVEPKERTGKPEVEKLHVPRAKSNDTPTVTNDTNEVVRCYSERKLVPCPFYSSIVPVLTCRVFRCVYMLFRATVERDVGLLERLRGPRERTSGGFVLGPVAAASDCAGPERTHLPTYHVVT